MERIRAVLGNASIKVPPAVMKRSILLRALREIYPRLLKRFGPQSWWPAETRFEVIVGAILTQNTSWTNVEKAISNLKRRDRLTPLALKNISPEELALLIKPSGYFNVKAKRLKHFIEFLFKEYDGKLDSMAKEPWGTLRKQLLSINGIGPETADSILLYALDKPVFVVDAYTRRILSRHNLVSHDVDYETLQGSFMKNLASDVKMFNEYHALLVRLGKEICKNKPACEVCPLNDLDPPYIPQTAQKP